MKKGSIIILTLVFGSIFLLTFGALTLSVLMSHRVLEQRIARSKALEIAEAGIQYYRWHLAHDPADFVSDTGEHTYKDPYGGTIGSFSLSIDSPEEGSSMVTLTSTGWTNNLPNVKRTLQVRYGKSSLAKYAFLLNSNVWFGPDEDIYGPVHSNGGIRMDGESNAEVTSALETYICGPEHGCDDEEKPGVWGDGENPKLWIYPTANIDFNELALDFADMEADADLILDHSSGTYGYQLIFSNNGTVDVNYVTALQDGVYAYDGAAWYWEYDSVKTTSPVSGYQDLPLSSYNLIFVKDKVWVQGVVDGFVTVVSSVPEGSTLDPSIIIQNDINYNTKDGSEALGLIAEKDIRIPLYSEDTLTINGALIAKDGHVFRNLYPTSGSYKNKEPYKTYNLRTKIETYGIIMSNNIWTWGWVNDSGNVVSGYQATDAKYDSHLVYSPPPYFPTEDEYEFISWEEIPNP